MQTMYEREVCGTCNHNKHDNDGSGIRQRGGYYCGNERSEYYACPTAYSDTCDDWEEKEF